MFGTDENPCPFFCLKSEIHEMFTNDAWRTIDCCKIKSRENARHFFQTKFGLFSVKKGHVHCGRQDEPV
ncbi:hypothetical protein BAT_0549 [Bacillus pumilus ATCC 7061]|nr:hypothetical protein BAT_0549 [Bacillus pumilus ATCC 7061]